MERTMILARHGRSVANAMRKESPAESRIQGADVKVPLDALGEWQSRASGLAFGRFIAERNINLMAIHSSDAHRALQTRDLALETGDIEAFQYTPDPRLQEICKGEWEGELRREIYIDPYLSRDWHFRYGSAERGGETPYEAGMRWLDWFQDATHPDIFPSSPGSTVMAFGHNGVTAYGLWLLTHPGKPPENYDETEQFRVDNGSGLVLTEYEDTWHVMDVIAPSREDYERTKKV
jgi:broad specificity phosphatase PhoE